MAAVADRVPEAKLQRVARRDPRHETRHETRPLPLRQRQRGRLLLPAPRLPARNAVVGAATL
jgi:hypothetical protein